MMWLFHFNIGGKIKERGDGKVWKEKQRERKGMGEREGERKKQGGERQTDRGGKRERERKHNSFKDGFI